MRDKTFTSDASELYKRLREMGDRARKIIADFVESHGGSYEIPIDEDDHVWVGEETYATALHTDSNGNILVCNSGEYSEHLHRMDDHNILDLADYLNNIDNNN